MGHSNKDVNICILMTACVNPNSFIVLNLKDPKTRAVQYLCALSYYFYNTNYNIVFAENSGTALPIPKEIQESNRVEFLTWKEVPEGIDRGKGYKEGKIHERVIAESKLYAESDIVIKVTGRLIVRNISKIVEELPLVHTYKRVLMTYWGWHFMYMDTRFMIAGKEVFELIQTYNNKINATTGMEEVYATACRELIKSDKVDYQLPSMLPLIDGVGGGTGEDYGKRNLKFYKKRIKYFFYYWKHKDVIINEIKNCK